MGKIFRKETVSCLRCKTSFTPDTQNLYCIPCEEKETNSKNFYKLLKTRKAEVSAYVKSRPSKSPR